MLAREPDGIADEEAVRRMCDQMVHRGPDAEGLLADGPCGLGHRRLSIIDLRPEAAQPMTNEDGSVAVVVNGEIYNFKELRKRLVDRGHVFRSASDSEVVLHLYEDRGPAALEDLRGMYAIALWDGRSRQLLLGRDRVGKKPLFYHHGPRGLVFASELGALLASGHVERRVDLEAIDAYLALQYVPSPLCAFGGVRKLPPGCRALVRPGEEPRPEAYSELRFDRPIRGSLPELAAGLRSRLEEAVRIRMVSDVPLGAFLSGGLDSSLVVALMARASTEPVKTFSIGFPAADASELPFARLVAERYGTDHHELEVSPDMTSVLPELVRHYGEPFADTSAVPTWYLSRHTRTGVTVALSGDGGDEAFAGYRRYVFARVGRALARLPAPVGSALSGAVSRVPLPRLQPIRDFARRLAEPEVSRYLGVAGHFPHHDRLDLYGPALRERFAEDRVARRFEEVLARGTARDPLSRDLELDIRTYLPDDILVKVDVASMAHSLEVRCPILDQEVLAYAASIPAEAKMRGLLGKVVLREAARGLVPDEILDRPKQGFALPIARWLREDLAPMARDLLLDRCARERGLFDPKAVERLLDGHRRGEGRGDQIWNLLVLEEWHRAFLDGKEA